MSKLEIPLAEAVADGEVVLVDPFGAAKGISYVCPECRGGVVFRREGHERSDPAGNVVRDPCFAHAADDYVARTCRGGSGESQRHRSAKIAVGHALRMWSAGKAMQPSFVHVCTCGARKHVEIERCDMIVVDQQVLGAGIGRLQPDVFVRHGESSGAIEVFYRHAIDDAKIEVYRALSWWVELDADSVLSGALEWKTIRASWIGPCAQCEAMRERRRKRREQNTDATGRAPVFDDTLAAWQRRTSGTCGGCGMRALNPEGVCTLCGKDSRSLRNPTVPIGTLTWPFADYSWVPKAPTDGVSELKATKRQGNVSGD